MLPCQALNSTISAEQQSQGRACRPRRDQPLLPSIVHLLVSGSEAETCTHFSLKSSGSVWSAWMSGRKYSSVGLNWQIANTSFSCLMCLEMHCLANSNFHGCPCTAPPVSPLRKASSGKKPNGNWRLWRQMARKREGGEQEGFLNNSSPLFITPLAKVKE